jgi:histone acetyltransferase
MEHKLETNQYPSLDSFLTDTQLVFENCRKYNPEGSIYVKNALKLERFVNEELMKYRKREA